MVTDLNPYRPSTAIDYGQPRRWLFYAGCLLTLIGGVVLYLLMLYIVPIEAKIHSDGGTEFQNHEQLIINISDHTAKYWYCWTTGAIVLAGGLRLVESKCKSEHKARIHTVLGLAAGFGTVCITSMVVSFWSTIVRVMPF
jgi:type II secretory pathway component PulF